jgi:hypothetical protein
MGKYLNILRFFSGDILKREKRAYFYIFGEKLEKGDIFSIFFIDWGNFLIILNISG